MKNDFTIMYNVASNVGGSGQTMPTMLDVGRGNVGSNFQYCWHRLTGPLLTTIKKWTL